MTSTFVAKQAWAELQNVLAVTTQGVNPIEVHAQGQSARVKGGATARFNQAMPQVHIRAITSAPVRVRVDIQD